MTLVRFNRNQFPSFGSFFDDFFGTELSDWSRSNFSSTDTTLPKVNIKEDVNAFTVEMAAPGMTKNDFDIHLNQNILTISSEKKEEVKDDGGKYTRKEYSYQSFQRSFTLPDIADGEKISAKYEHGILTIGIPKKEEAKPRSPKSIKIS